MPYSNHERRYFDRIALSDEDQDKVKTANRKWNTVLILQVMQSANIHKFKYISTKIYKDRFNINNG